MYEIPQKPQLKIKTKQPDKRKFAVIPISILSKKLTEGQFKVLIAFASYCNKGGFTYVALERIAQDVGLKKSTVHYHLKKLEQKGIIKSERNYYPLIKGSTRRIIYDDKLTDEDVQKISNEPKEPYTNKELRQLASIKNSSNNNELANSSSTLGLNETDARDMDILTRLKSNGARGHEIAMAQRDLRLGLPISVIIHKYKHLLG